MDKSPQYSLLIVSLLNPKPNLTLLTLTYSDVIIGQVFTSSVKLHKEAPVLSLGKVLMSVLSLGLTE